MTDEARLRPRPFLLGLALVTAATLALELLDTRLLSVVTWYSLAFLVIAMGLFGLTAGAVRVYLRSAEYEGAELMRQLSRDARRFAWSVPLSLVLLLVIPLRQEATLTTVALFVVFAAAIALPFYPAGSVVAAALTRTSLPVGRVYAVDLIGAALGAPLTFFLLSVTRGPAAILAMSVVAAAASACFAQAGGHRDERRLGVRAAVVLGLLFALDASSMRGFAPLWIKGRPELHELIEADLWNSHSRVIVNKPVRMPAIFWGRGAKCPAPNILQRGAEIDGHAATPLYDAHENLAFLDCDVTSAAHAIRPHGAQAVIGVGGSRDIQAALLHGHTPVVGIELNGRLLEVLRGPVGEFTGIAHRPEVQLVHDEARSWLSRTPMRFNLIQMSLIDTWAATGAGAHALGENALYTLEGWRVFLDRLEPGGVFTVSRWSTVESVRLIALAVAALLDRGVARPADHLALLGAGSVTTLIVGRDPLTPADEQELRALADEKGFSVVVSPHDVRPPQHLAEVLAVRDRAELDRKALSPLFDFRPPTDDRPFFFNVIRPQALWLPLPEFTQGTIEGNLLATRTLGMSFFASLVLVVWAIAVPLARRARPTGHAGRGLGAALAYFGCIGVGFMLAEIALLQRMSLVLGHPSYSLMVVLASLVAATGVGSLLSDRLPLDRAPACFVYPLVLAVVLVVVAVAWPSLAPSVAAAPTTTRVLFAITVCSVLGVALGVAFPAGLRIARQAHQDETPWLWGINGMGSVLASSAAIMLALELGFRTLTLIAAAFYVALVPCIVGMRRGALRAQELTSPSPRG